MKIAMKARTVMTISARGAVTALCLCLFAVGAQAQDVGIGCRLEDYSVRPLVYGRVGDPNQKLQVVVLQDPAGNRKPVSICTTGQHSSRCAIWARNCSTRRSRAPAFHCPSLTKSRNVETKVKYPTFASSSSYQASQAGNQHVAAGHYRRYFLPWPGLHARLHDDDRKRR